MSSINEMYRMSAGLASYVNMMNSPAMEAVRQISNGPMVQAMQQFVNNPAMQSVLKSNASIRQVAQQLADNPALKLMSNYINSIEYQNTLASLTPLQDILNQMQPVFLSMPIYNSQTISMLKQNASIVTALNDVADNINKILPDMSVISSLSKTVTALSPVFESTSKAYESMQPLWDTGCILSVNPKSIWTGIENSEELQEQIRDIAIDKNEITEDLGVLCTSSNPKQSMEEFAKKWRAKISGMAFSALVWFGITICSGGVQYMAQPIYQKILPQIAISDNQYEDKILDKRELEFSIFCIENIAIELGRTGDEVYQMLTRDSDILDEYIIANYDILHTQSKEYIIHDIIDYMREQGVIE